MNIENIFHNKKSFDNRNFTILGYGLLSCIVFHTVATFFFASINIYQLEYYNIFSTVLFVILLLANHAGYSKIATILAGIEIEGFVLTTTLALGWDSGVQHLISCLILFIFYSEAINLRSKMMLCVPASVVYIYLEIYARSVDTATILSPILINAINIFVISFILFWIMLLSVIYERTWRNFRNEIVKSQNLVNDVENMLNKNMHLGNKIGSISQEFYNAFKINLELQSIISSSIEQIAHGSKENSDQNEKISDKVHYLSNMLQQLSDAINQIFINSANSLNLSKQGNNSLIELTRKLDDSVGTTTSLDQSLQELSQKTQEISQIVNIINSIANQTSLLSLNASIEAARAGAEGKGFAVVAEEIKKLADQSNEATDNIKKLILGIQNSVGISMVDMKKVYNAAIEQKQYSLDTIEVFENIDKDINDINDKVEIINKDINKIDSFKDDIVARVDNISALLQQTSASVEEITASILDQESSMNSANLKLKELLDVSNEMKLNKTE